VGEPGVKIRLLSGKGLAFQGKVSLNVDLETNLPWPFNEVVKVLAKIVIKVIEVVLNTVASLVTFEIYPGELQLPGQRTTLVFRDFAPFPYFRAYPPTLPVEDRKFLGFDVGLDFKAG